MLRIYFGDISGSVPVYPPAFFADKELLLLRNQSRGKGVGFFEAGNFFPDFILWLIAGVKQYVAFVDPKGLGRVHGFDDPKVRFHAKVKEIEARLGDPTMVLSFFIVSNTHRSNVAWWKEESATEQDFANNHVLFQTDEKDTYVGTLLSEASVASRLQLEETCRRAEHTPPDHPSAIPISARN